MRPRTVRRIANFAPVLTFVILTVGWLTLRGDWGDPWRDSFGVAWGPKTAGWRLSLQPEVGAVQEGNPLILLVSQWNCSDSELRLDLGGLSLDCGLEIADGNNGAVLAKVSHERMGSRVVYPAKPGEKMDGRVNASAMYRFPPGKYTITGERTYQPMGYSDPIRIESNPVTVTVLARPKAVSDQTTGTATGVAK